MCACLYLPVWVYLCLHLNLASQGQTGIVAGDETGWKPLHIKHDSLEADFMFSKPELLWLRSSWKASTGRELKHPTLDCEQILAQIQAGVYIKKSPAP